MALRDRVAVYNAANNIEALFVRDGLIAAGVEAFVIEDLSIVGGWVGGLIPEIHAFLDVGEAELPDGWTDDEADPDDLEAGSESGS